MKKDSTMSLLIQAIKNKILKKKEVVQIDFETQSKEFKRKDIVIYKNKAYVVNAVSKNILFIDNHLWNDISTLHSYCKGVPMSECEKVNDITL